MDMEGDGINLHIVGISLPSRAVTFPPIQHLNLVLVLQHFKGIAPGGNPADL